jgi:Sulfotransferase family
MNNAATIAQPLRPLFVLSVYRSGSSLLYALLNQHSQIALLYEGDLPAMQLFLWGQFRNGGWRQRWEFWNQGASRHGIAMDSLPARVSNVWEATRFVYANVARRKQAAVCGEKSPRWYNCALRVAENFPDARFIFLWRDLQSVVGSVARAALTEKSFRKAGFAREMLLGTEKLRQACDALKAQGRLVHEVNYEDLTANTSECMRQICQFLELEFEPQVASLKGADLSAITEGEHHKLVRSNRIVGEPRQQEVLSPALAAKSQRYICRWKQRYGGKWPKYPVELPKGTRPPPWLELWCDRIANQTLLLWEKVFIVILHQIRPLFYRKKYVRRAQVSSQS